MKVFLIILAVLVVITLLILSLSVKLTVIFDEGWTTRVKILFIEKDIELSKILSFILFPQKAAQDAVQQIEEEKEEKKEEKEKPKEPEKKETEIAENNDEAVEKKPAKPNFIKKLWDDEGVVGIMLLISNLLQTAGSAISTLFKGLHIHSLYVNIIVGGGDAADIADTYGTICGIYYPIKGIILNGMRVDEYEDNIQADFIAPFTEQQFHIIASINVRLVLRMLLRAGWVFIKNFIKNK